MSDVKNLVEVIARALADYPEAVRVTEYEHQDTVRIELTTKPGDLGKLVGRQGRTAAAVRTIAQVAADRNGLRATVDFLDRAE